MRDTIYLIGENATLRPLTEAPYESEALLQTLLERYPKILAGEQIDEKSPRRWLFISREVGVPDEELAANRWSIDHLFLDQDGIPTLVEVKRASDSRTRRRVVAQMLDYAANAIRYWPVHNIQSQFTSTCDANGVDPDEKLDQLLEGDSVDSFWNDVKTNLKAGRIRLLFVADKIPRELRRIVEFLNEQMDPAQVLALELKQYAGEGRKTLVPTVIGQTAEAEQRKSTAPSPEWNEGTLFAELEDRYGKEEAAVARRYYEWAKNKDCDIDWRPGKKLGGFIARYPFNGDEQTIFKVQLANELAFMTTWYANSKPFQDSDTWAEFRSRMDDIGLYFPQDRSNMKHPRLTFTQLTDEELFQKTIRHFEWILAQVNNTSAES